jgi:ubiquinone/menaquinone biosynthesis C-methylase UbiE
LALYHDRILPKLIKLAMSDARLAPYRLTTLSPCSGKVLELGIGSGANLTFYPKTVSELVGVDPHAGLIEAAAEAKKQVEFPVELIQCSAEQLPFLDYTFDFVVSTFTLCSVTASNMVLKEVARVLKPGGTFLYLEHGLSPGRSVRLLQNLLNPLQKSLAGGCQLVKNHVNDINSCGFAHSSQKQFYLPGVPGCLGYMYSGRANIR